MSPPSVSATARAKQAEDQSDKKEKEEHFNKQERDEKKGNSCEQPAGNGSENLIKHGFKVYVHDVHNGCTSSQTAGSDNYFKDLLKK